MVFRPNFKRSMICPLSLELHLYENYENYFKYRVDDARYYNYISVYL